MTVLHQLAGLCRSTRCSYVYMHMEAMGIQSGAEEVVNTSYELVQVEETSVL